jgi:hypothetical protein
MIGNFKTYTQKEDEFIINCHLRFSVVFMANRLKRSPNGVWDRMVQLGLRAREDQMDLDMQPVQKTSINHIIKPFRDKSDYYLRGRLAESVILGLA